MGRITALAQPPLAMRRAAVKTLAELHSVEVVRSGLAELGKPEGFVGRQVRGWADRWYRARTE